MEIARAQPTCCKLSPGYVVLDVGQKYKGEQVSIHGNQNF